MPPEQAASRCTASAEQMPATARIASMMASVYLPNAHAACRSSGLRQDITNTCCPWAVRYSIMLRPGARSRM